jgi:hypothetical protein
VRVQCNVDVSYCRGPQLTCSTPTGEQATAAQLGETPALTDIDAWAVDAFENGGVDASPRSL